MQTYGNCWGIWPFTMHHLAFHNVHIAWKMAGKLLIRNLFGSEVGNVREVPGDHR